MEIIRIIKKKLPYSLVSSEDWGAFMEAFQDQFGSNWAKWGSGQFGGGGATRPFKVKGPTREKTVRFIFIIEET